MTDRHHVHVEADALPEGLWVARARFERHPTLGTVHGTGDGLTVESACIRAIEDLRRKTGTP